MTGSADFESAFSLCPLVAILRGITPDEIVETGAALIEAGFTMIEIPLNSPEPLESIRRLSEMVGPGVVIGAGTVLDPAAVAAVEAAGGALIVTPNFNPKVVSEAARRNLVPIIGVATPSEAFAALDCGAVALKLFPAEASAPEVVRAMLAVLPKETRILPVGGITPSSMGRWIAAGAAGFGLGSALYRPAQAASETRMKAREFIAAWKAR